MASDASDCGCEITCDVDDVQIPPKLTVRGLLKLCGKAIGAPGPWAGTTLRLRKVTSREMFQAGDHRVRNEPSLRLCGR